MSLDNMPSKERRGDPRFDQAKGNDAVKKQSIEPPVQKEPLKPPLFKDRLLGGIFLPEFYADLGYMDGIVHRVDKDRRIIRPFLASVIAGRVNNPFLLIEPTDTDKPSCREADDVGIEWDPVNVVRKRGIRGAEVIDTWYARPGGKEDVRRLIRIFGDKKIDGHMLSRQRIKDIALIREAGAMLGIEKARLGKGDNINGDPETYTPINILGERYREGTYAIVDRLIREHGADDEHPLIQYEASIDDSSSDESVVVDRTVTLPQWVTEPRQELREGDLKYIKKINIESALAQLTGSQRQGYQFYADVMYFLGDPLIRTALNPPPRQIEKAGPYKWGSKFPRIEDITRLPRDKVLGLIRR